MTIEQQIFDRCQVNVEKLKEYGFREQIGKLVFSRELAHGLNIVVEYDGSFKGRVEDSELDEEYTNFRMEVPGKFASEIKKEFVNCLENIREHTCYRQEYRFQQTERINQYVQNKFNVACEHLWEDSPDFSIYRNPVNRKWFMLNGTVARNKLNRLNESAEEVDIINIRIDNKDLRDLLEIPGIYEAYHMNKKNWITIAMDGTLTDEDIERLIIDSYEIIEKNGTKTVKRKKGGSD